MCATVAVWSVLVMIALPAHSKLYTLRCRSEDCVELPGDPKSAWTEFEVEGKKLRVTNDQLDCQNNDVFESHALPVGDRAVKVAEVTLIKCPLPMSHSIAEILSVLNFTLKYNKTQGKLIFKDLPPTPSLTAAHFTGLEDLNYLVILGQFTSPPSLAPECLKPLRRLEKLTIQFVSATELEVPASLLDLYLSQTNLNRLPVAPALETLTLNNWQKPVLPPLPCKSLRMILLYGPSTKSLPDYWLKNCSVLEDLKITWLPKLVHLPAMLLHGAGSLRRLSLVRTGLKQLPVGFLNHTPKLQVLELVSNQLSTFPSDFFAESKQIEKLDLSDNYLENSVIAALTPLVHLTELRLSYNENLGDFCEENGYSPLQNMTKLEELNLSRTGITRICLDLKYNMTQLQTLDLTSTKLSNMTFKDLLFKRVVESFVGLPDTATRAIEMTQEDYDNVARGDYTNTTLTIDTELQCDCRLYWTRRALSLSPPVLKDPLCSDEIYLEDVPLDSMCLRPDECKAAGLPEQCQCEMWPPRAPNHDPLSLVRVHCENAGLNSVPPLTGLKSDRVYELLLARNRITDLRAEDIQENVRELDLRYNSLKTVDQETAKRIQEMDGLLRLGGNQMDCSCNAAPLLRALHARNQTLTDLSNATCSDGGLLLAAAIIDCPISLETIGAWLAVVFAIVLLVLVVGVKFFWSQQRRFFARAVLHRWGVRWRVDEPTDDDREFDAFLTFSHKDSAVARAVLTRLEPQYWLCVHVRDWTPGELIPAQITKSVRESRRTVALVSRHFLTSKWARAEFREAHTASMLDARPRLVVVLLEEPGALQMDEELRGYIATRTYLRWGEPLFWDKLAVALPLPRPSPPSPPLMELLPLTPCDSESNALESFITDAGL